MTDREWKEYRHVKDFMANPGSLRRHAATLGVSPTAWAYLVCKYAPAIYREATGAE